MQLIALATLKMRLALPSNSSYKFFPNNTISEYTVKLPQTLDLSKGKWEVGLEELSFYKSWFNVTNAKLTIFHSQIPHEIQIPDGYYKCGKTIIDQLNASCDEQLPDNVHFRYNKITRMCSFKVKLQAGIEVSINFSPELREILGVPSEERICTLLRTNKYDLHVACVYPVKLHTIFNILVYSDLASETVVGDIESSLLRSVVVEDGHWKMQCTNFNRIQYVPVSQKHISTITMYIYTDYGKRIPFRDGRVVCTLYLRKVSPLHH